MGQWKQRQSHLIKYQRLTFSHIMLMFYYELYIKYPLVLDSG